MAEDAAESAGAKAPAITISTTNMSKMIRSLPLGPTGGRFIYINSGTYAGHSDSCWSRRAKVPLSGITWELIEEALTKSGVLLEARIAGTAKDGGPACATVQLLEDGWSVRNIEQKPD